jgi:hypothetical protein
MPNGGRSITSETGSRVNAIAEWRSLLAGVTGALLLFATLSGLSIYLLPFSEFNQLSVLLHTGMGLAMLAPVTWYLVRHWLARRGGNLSHYQLLGYAAVALLAICVASGVVVTWQGIVGPRMSYAWDLVHLVSGIAAALFVIVHLITIIVRRVSKQSLLALRGARRVFFVRSTVGAAVLLAATGFWAGLHSTPEVYRPLPDDYNWKFGEDRPFAPSLARLDDGSWSVQNASRDTQRRAALSPGALTGSAGCGTSGCHQEIYDEWLPSAHRYSAIDDMFQRVQSLMAEETSPEHTRYCAGCHDPISLLSGAKDAGNITLSAEGSNEGSSCLVCHSIVQTDVQGNGDYTISPPRRYMYEQSEGRLAKLTGDFLIRTYPRHHVESFSRPLYKTPEFCGACHKQYIDAEVNTDIGKVQGQNQYDSWKNSRWYHEGNPDLTISCRECHMPLAASRDPARGDRTDTNRSANDGRHRSHGMVGANQYIPLLHDLPGAARHVEQVEQWLRGEIEIPEIAHKWTVGPVVRMAITAPPQVQPGDEVSVQVTLTNNKTGHDFPTGPLDMIESWIELRVTDDQNRVLYHTGGLTEDGRVDKTEVWFKADGFDRRGEPIDRHNLWDLVGAGYKRTLYPGVTDIVEVSFQCPSMARGRLRQSDEKLAPGQRSEAFAVPMPPDAQGELHVSAVLWYRKANPEFLERVYGASAGVRSPVTAMSKASATIRITPLGQPITQ